MLHLNRFQFSWKHTRTYSIRKTKMSQKNRKWALLPRAQRASYYGFSHYRPFSPHSLLGVTVITAFCADYCKFLWNSDITDITFLLVVASIEETAHRYSIPKPFIGLILLPIVVRDLRFLHIWNLIGIQGNAAEHVTAVYMALKDRMETTIAICVGSSIVSTSVHRSRRWLNFECSKLLYSSYHSWSL